MCFGASLGVELRPTIDVELTSPSGAVSLLFGPNWFLHKADATPSHLVPCLSFEELHSKLVC